MKYVSGDSVIQTLDLTLRVQGGWDTEVDDIRYQCEVVIGNEHVVWTTTEWAIDVERAAEYAMQAFATRLREIL